MERGDYERHQFPNALAVIKRCRLQNILSNGKFSEGWVTKYLTFAPQGTIASKQWSKWSNSDSAE